MPRSITPAPSPRVEPFPLCVEKASAVDGNFTTPVVPISEVVCTRSSWFRADGIAAAPLPDFKLLPKSRSAIPLLSESVDLQAIDAATAAGSRSPISGSTLMLSGFDKDIGALDRHPPDQKLC